MARAWIEGKAWTGKADNRDEARNKLIKSLKVKESQMKRVRKKEGEKARMSRDIGDRRKWRQG